MNRKDYKQKARGLIETILKGSKVLVACSDDCEDQILSFIVYRDVEAIGRNILFFAYTKLIFRNLGFFNKLAFEAQNKVNFTQYAFLSNDKYFKKYKNRKSLKYDAFYFFDESIMGDYKDES